MTPCRASAALTAGLFLLASGLAACSRSGTLFGDIFVQTLPGEVVSRAARIDVSAIPSTGAFERDWTAAVAAFQAEVEPARKAQQAAAASLEEARLAWDRNLAGGRMAGAGASRRHRGPRTSARDRQLWEQLRAVERVLFQAKLRVWEVAHKHDGQADALLAKHAAQRVQTDADGHYVLVGLPTGKAILYARIPMRDQMLVWFLPVLVRSGMQRVDLTEGNHGGWPFVP